MPGHHVNLVDPAGCPRIRLYLARQFYRRHFGDQPGAQLLRHGLHVQGGQAQLARDLPVGKVQAHEVEAQHPRPQRLVMPGQHRAGKIVEAGRARLAPIALPMRLRVVASVPDHRETVAARAAYALGPAMLAHKRKALGIVHQAGEVDQVRYRHDGGDSLREPVGCSHSSHHIRYPPAAPSRPPPRNPTRAFRVCSLTEGGCVAWILRLMKIGVKGEGPCTDIMEIRRPGDLVGIDNLGLTLSEAKRLLAGVQRGPG